ncbi:unnamed protein product [Moneuplotes crassus]|uniref:Uncharacterized protein n=1 Tax=Euplotes crassus TaxID=5936 RepID=A0AAD1XU32_EUPCR|nr:unnamed protein product [Moneuplotes crassus]
MEFQIMCEDQRQTYADMSQVGEEEEPEIQGNEFCTYIKAVFEKEILQFEESKITVFEWYRRSLILAVEREVTIPQPDDLEGLRTLLTKYDSTLSPIHIDWKYTSKDPTAAPQLVIKLQAYLHYAKSFEETQQENNPDIPTKYTQLIPEIKHLSRKFESIYRTIYEYSFLTRNDFFSSSDSFCQLIN